MLKYSSDAAKFGPYWEKLCLLSKVRPQAESQTSAPKLWNNLPLEIRMVKSVKSFKLLVRFTYTIFSKTFEDALFCRAFFLS